MKFWNQWNFKYVHKYWDVGDLCCVCVHAFIRMWESEPCMPHLSTSLCILCANAVWQLCCHGRMWVFVCSVTIWMSHCYAPASIYPKGPSKVRRVVLTRFWCFRVVLIFVLAVCLCVQTLWFWLTHLKKTTVIHQKTFSDIVIILCLQNTFSVLKVQYLPFTCN